MLVRRFLLILLLSTTLLTNALPTPVFAQDNSTPPRNHVFMPWVTKGGQTAEANSDTAEKENHPDWADDTAKEFDVLPAEDLSIDDAAVPPRVTYVGIIPEQDLCPVGAEKIKIFTDNEDTRNSNSSSGWIGATVADQNTTYSFCRVAGEQFKPLVTGQHYALLSLSAQCPRGAQRVVRQQDNEDTRNKNWSQGALALNVQNKNMTWVFCAFAGGAPTMNAFPDIGIAYGVFAGTALIPGEPTGHRFSDDENTRNKNTWRPGAITGVIDGTADTTMRFARVRTVPNSGLAYKVGATYQYDWQLTVNTEGLREDGKGADVESSQTRLHAQVAMPVLEQGSDGAYRAAILIQKPEIQTVLADGQSYPLDDPEFLAQLQAPLLFIQSRDGKILEVRYMPGLSSEIVNLQKGVVNALQLQLRPEPIYQVEEVGGQGNYLAHYHVTRTPEVLTVVKTYTDEDFSQLIQKGDQGLQLNSQSRIEGQMQNGAPRSITVQEVIEAKHASAGNAEQGEFWSRARTDGALQLMTISETDPALKERLLAEKYEASSLNADLRGHVSNAFILDPAAVDLGQEFADLLAEPTNPARIERFVALVKGDQDGILLPKIHSALLEFLNEEVAGAYIDILGLAATPSAQLILLQDVLFAEKFDPLLQERALTHLAQVAAPEPAVIEGLQKLSADPASPRWAPTTLAVGALMETVNRQQPEMASRWLEQIMQQMSQSQEGDTLELYLHALGNAGLPAALEIVKPYLLHENPWVRLSAVTALRKVPSDLTIAWLIERMNEDPEALIREAATTILVEWKQATPAVTAAAIHGQWIRSWSPRVVDFGPLKVDLPGDITIKSPPDAPALTLDANQQVTAQLFGSPKNLFRARLLSEVMSGQRRFGAYFWMGNNTLLAQFQANVGCAYQKSGTLWQGSQQFFQVSTSIPVVWILTVDLSAQATGYARLTYNYQHDLCNGSALSATGTITPEAWVHSSGSAYLSLYFIRGGVVLSADILRGSLPVKGTVTLYQTGSNPPQLSFCIDAKATLQALNGSLSANAQRRRFILFGGWRDLGTWTIWRFSTPTKTWNLWVEC